MFHAKEIRFKDPVSGKARAFRVELPTDYGTEALKRQALKFATVPS